jgi:hypothetical protein
MIIINCAAYIETPSVVDRVTAAETVTVVVTEVVGSVTVPVVFLDVDGQVLLHVHGVGHGMGDRDLDRYLDRVWHWAVYGHRDVLLDVHGIRHWFLDGHRVRHVFLDRHDDRSVNDDWHLFGDVHGADVSVAVVRAQQTVVGQTVPLAVSTVSIAQAPEASFALLLFRRLLSGGGGGLHGIRAD